MKKKLRVGAIGDIHVKETSQDAYKALFREVSDMADILVLCGDLTDLGLPQEAEILGKELEACTIPVVGVLGNHDHEGGHPDEIKKILTQHKMVILDDETFELDDVGFAGVKGFGGGFEKHMLAAFGESEMKHFAHEAVNEALKLENALSRLRTPKKVVALHYAPIKQTVVGEPMEIYPFLGSTRLVEPIDNYDVSVVFHGHVDYGTHEGKTPKGIPVFNVALPLLRRITPEKPYLIYEI